MDCNILGDTCFPTQGIVAGSPHATYELTAYTVGAIRVLKEQVPSARISIHVDDLTMQVSAPSQTSAVAAMVILARTARILFGELSLPFAPNKAIIISTHKKAAMQVRRRIGGTVGVYCKQTRSLGLDLTLQRTRARRTQI